MSEESDLLPSEMSNDPIDCIETVHNAVIVRGVDMGGEAVTWEVNCNGRHVRSHDEGEEGVKGTGIVQPAVNANYRGYLFPY